MKRRTKTRKKLFKVFGQFKLPAGERIELWSGDALRWPIALRQAILDISRRPAVKWKHLKEANFLIAAPGESFNAKDTAATGSKKRTRRH